MWNFFFSPEEKENSFVEPNKNSWIFVVIFIILCVELSEKENTGKNVFHRIKINK